MAVRKGKSLRATTKERREAHDQLLLQFETWSAVHRLSLRYRYGCWLDE
jgi:hypothetical protein